MEQQLEAAWQLLDSGDLDGAQKAALAAGKLDGTSPEPHVILGAVATTTGDLVSAKASFKRAIELDPEYFEPLFLAAQVASSEGSLEEALDYAERALDHAEEEEEYLDTLLLKAELELALEDHEAAGETLAELPPVDLPHAEFHLRAGGCLLELEELDAAERHYQSAARLEPNSGDAHHGLGLIAEARGDDQAMREHFAKVRAFDLKAPPPEEPLSKEQIEAVVDAAIEELPKNAQKLLANVPVLLEDYPSEELVADGLDPRAYGLFTGTPYPEQGNVAGHAPHLEHVLLFKRNLERDAASAEELAEAVRITLLHETGHFFGMDEEDLEKVGLD